MLRRLLNVSLTSFIISLIVSLCAVLYEVSELEVIWSMMCVGLSAGVIIHLFWYALIDAIS